MRHLLLILCFLLLPSAVIPNLLSASSQEVSSEALNHFRNSVNSMEFDEWAGDLAQNLYVGQKVIDGKNKVVLGCPNFKISMDFPLEGTVSPDFRLYQGENPAIFVFQHSAEDQLSLKTALVILKTKNPDQRDEYIDRLKKWSQALCCKKLGPYEVIAFATQEVNQEEALAFTRSLKVHYYIDDRELIDLMGEAKKLKEGIERAKISLESPSSSSKNHVINELKKETKKLKEHLQRIAKNLEHSSTKSRLTTELKKESKKLNEQTQKIRKKLKSL